MRHKVTVVLRPIIIATDAYGDVTKALSVKPTPLACMEGNEATDRENPDSPKNIMSFLIGIIIAISCTLVAYFLLKRLLKILLNYLIWYFDTFIGPSWL